MKNNETGEFELVLGNRQLLSGFFIVVILFAVFFVMGYIVGRNSTPATQLAANRDQNSGAAAPSNTRPQPASGTAPAPQNPPAAAAEPPKEDAGGNAPASGQPATQAAQPPAAKTELPAPAKPAVPAPVAVEPAPGETYLQVVSVGAREAEVLARALKDKGFPSSLGPGPNGRTTRVLVGPYRDLSTLGKAKAELENLGFHPIVKR